MRQALDLGINFFDTANVYSSGDSERVVGKFLKANTRREAVVIATKVHGVMRDEPNGRGLSRKAILYELDQSLSRLGTDYVDLYQIHRWDYDTPIEETLEALHDVVKAGQGAVHRRILDVCMAVCEGAVSRRAEWVDAVCEYAEPLQPAVSRRRARDDGAVRGEKIAVIPWSPLARGRLTRAWQAESTKRSETDRFGNTMYSRTEEDDRKVVDRLGEIAEKRGVPRAQVALAWMLSKPVVTAPIVGATKPHHLQDAVAALELKLTAEEIAALEEPYTPHPVLGFN